MTEADARAQLEVLGRLEGRDLADLEGCTIAELALLTRTYRDAAAPAERSTWDEFLAVLNMAVQVAGPLSSIASAFTTIFGTVAAAKGL